MQEQKKRRPVSFRREEKGSQGSGFRCSREKKERRFAVPGNKKRASKTASIRAKRGGIILYLAEESEKRRVRLRVLYPLRSRKGREEKKRRHPSRLIYRKKK